VRATFVVKFALALALFAGACRCPLTGAARCFPPIALPNPVMVSV
jgi:hypothetical protein